MKISARNILRGTIHSIVKGPVDTEMTILLPGGDSIENSEKPIFIAKYKYY